MRYCPVLLELPDKYSIDGLAGALRVSRPGVGLGKSIKETDIRPLGGKSWVPNTPPPLPLYACTRERYLMEAAKKFFLVARPLRERERGGGGKALVIGPLKKELFCGSPKLMNPHVRTVMCMNTWIPPGNKYVSLHPGAY